MANVLKNPYVQINRQFTPVYAPGEIYSFYINFNEPISDPGFANFRLCVIDCDGNLVASNIGILSKQIVKGVNLYNIYSTFTFPMLADGYYHFVIIDVVEDIEKCRSNHILVDNSAFNETTDYVVYYDTQNQIDYNFFYKDIPDFKQMLRLPLAEIDHQFEVDRTQYQNVTNHRIRNTAATQKEWIRLELNRLDDDAHRAAAAMFMHDKVFVNNSGLTAKGAYNVDRERKSDLNNGTIDLYLTGELNDDFYQGTGFDTLILCGDEVITEPLTIQSNIF